MKPISILILLCCTVVIFTTVPLYSEDNGEAEKDSTAPILYNASFGIGLTFGQFQTYKQSGDFSSDPGYAGGVSLVFEKMFSNRFGIHSGLGYLETEFKIKNTEIDNVFVDYWHLKAVSMPLLLITSFNFDSFSINLLTGLNFYHIFSSQIKTGDETTDLSEADALPHTISNPVMASAGVNFKIRISKFTDLYLGAIGEISIQDIFNDTDSNISRFVSTRAIAGVLFRTDIFPMNNKTENNNGI